MAHHQLTIGPAPLVRNENRAKPAKVTSDSLRKTEKDVLWGELGKAMVYVCYDAKLSIKEFATTLGKDAGQVQRQMEGQERPQIEAVFAIPEYRAKLVEALARITPEVSVDTVIKIKRSA